MSDGGLRANINAGHYALGPQQRVVLAVVLTSYLMIVVDTSIVIAALPKIQAGLGFTSTGLSWVHSAYMLSFGGLLLLAARAGDLFGRRRMLLLGLGIFTVASLAIGLAPTPAVMVLGRVVQGAGAAVLAPSTLALLSVHFAEGHQRTRALAWYGATAGVSASAGLVLGGLITDWMSWRVGFFINVPIGLLLIRIALTRLQETERHAGSLDAAGALTSLSGVLLLVYGIVRSAEAGWLDPVALACTVAGGMLLAGFVLLEARARYPLIPLRLFASIERSGAYAARFLFMGGMVGFFFFCTQYLQGVLGYTALQTGAAFLPATVINFAMAMGVPQLSRRFHHATILAVSLLLATAGLAWLACADVASSYWTAVALPMVLIGIGQGGSLSPLTLAAVRGVEAHDAGAASGVVNVAHQLGGSVGLAILVAVSHAGGQAMATPQQLATAISRAMAASAVMLGLAFCIALLCRRRR